MSVPTIASITTANLTVSSALLGATVTGTGITETGIAYSLTSVNSAPVPGGSGVLTSILSPVAASGGLFTKQISGLLPGRAYTFNAYSTNASGTSTPNATIFVTPPLPAFGTCTNTNAAGNTIYVRLRTGKIDQIDFVTKIDAIGQPMLNGTYRDLFNGFNNSIASGEGTTAFVTTDIKNSTISTVTHPTATTGTSVSDDVGHVAPRQGAWLESGLLFTTANGLQFPYLWKDFISVSNALTSDSPTNVTS